MNAVAECQQRGLEWRKNDQQGTFSFLNQKDGPILALSARLWSFCGIKQLSVTPPPKKDASMPPHGWDLFVSRPTRPTHISCWSQFPNFHFPARTRPRCRQISGNCSDTGLSFTVPILWFLIWDPHFSSFSLVKRCPQWCLNPTMPTDGWELFCSRASVLPSRPTVTAPPVPTMHSKRYTCQLLGPLFSNSIFCVFMCSTLKNVYLNYFNLWTFPL